MSGADCIVSACQACKDACTAPVLQAGKLGCLLRCHKDGLKKYAFNLLCCCCRYNYACVCAHAMASGAVQGDDMAAAQQECLSNLSHLTALGMTTPEQIMNDADFLQAKEQAWFAPVRDISTGQSQPPQQA